MFKVEIKAETFKNLINIVSTVVDEVKLTITPEAVIIKAIDPSHIAMIHVVVDSDAFISYEADDSEIGLDLGKIKSIFKLIGSGDVVAMEHDPDQGRLTIQIGNIVRRMALIETSGLSDPRVPNVELPVSAKLSLDQLQKGIRAAETVADTDNYFQIEIGQDGFELLCSNDVEMASLKVPAAELIEVVAPHTATSQYSLENFSNITKVIPSGAVEVDFDSDLPIKLLFDLADGHAHVTYLLAPRIEKE